MDTAADVFGNDAILFETVMSEYDMDTDTETFSNSLALGEWADGTVGFYSANPHTGESVIVNLPTVDAIALAQTILRHFGI